MDGLNWRDQRGSSEAVGYLGMIPLVLMTVLLVLQLSMFCYTLVVAESAVRDAARAAAIGGDVDMAVRRIRDSTSIQIQFDQPSCTDGVVRVDLWATVPSVAAVLNGERIHRWAVMQSEAGC